MEVSTIFSGKGLYSYYSECRDGGRSKNLRGKHTVGLLNFMFFKFPNYCTANSIVLVFRLFTIKLHNFFLQSWILSSKNCPLTVQVIPPALCIAIGYAIGKEKENSIKVFLHLSEDFSPTSVRGSLYNGCKLLLKEHSYFLCLMFSFLSKTSYLFIRSLRVTKMRNSLKQNIFKVTKTKIPSL